MTLNPFYFEIALNCFGRDNNNIGKKKQAKLALHGTARLYGG